jgi:hypothetical protein
MADVPNLLARGALIAINSVRNIDLFRLNIAWCTGRLVGWRDHELAAFGLKVELLLRIKNYGKPRDLYRRRRLNYRSTAPQRNKP